MTSDLAAFRLSAQQRQLWAIHGADASTYRARLELLIEGPLDSKVLKNTLRRIVERHEILRTAFELPPTMKVPVQVVRPASEFNWRENYSNEDETEQTVYLLTQPPPLCATLTKLSRHQHVLRVSLPLLCADSSTMRKLASEI